ncbi:jg22901 [Pararge aegeria aegeria]|uniref:Jg22901 protein n=1 Tax=Pararge aegeria aegeria TaxID=348720 RepID=A0A8S4RYH9_9NEOP|nr:jg22901 [Pararge aegeria aegeria]
MTLTGPCYKGPGIYALCRSYLALDYTLFIHYGLTLDCNLTWWKPTTDNESNKRKPLYERSFWDDRVSKSDAEDKSLSNDETPLPSCPRQPPDGVETPSDVIEKTPDLPTRLPPRLSTGTAWNSTPQRSRFSYSSRTQDARSEASVKDKIAMFSTDLATSSDRLDKCGTLPIRSNSTLRKNSTPYTNAYSEVSSLDRRLTKSQDNLDETPRSYKRNADRPEVLGALENTITEKNIKRFNQPDIINKPLFYGSTTTIPSDVTFTRPSYHVRSISDDNGSKNASKHKSNLEYLIEQRKKSMSKLRGLVIPEVQAPIVDLPEIKVLDSLSKTFLYNSSNKETKKEINLNKSKSVTLTENKWKPNFIPNNIPKYSPAFKRKSLQVYNSSLSKESTPERKLGEMVEVMNRNNNYSNSPALKPVRNTYEFSKTSFTKSGSLFNKDFYKSNNTNSNIQDFKNVEIKICTTTDIVDSDNDSAMSSTQSSYRSSASSPMHTIENIESDSSRLSPRISHYNTYSIIKCEMPNKCITEKNFEDYNKRKICRSMSSDTNISLSSSAGSAATSGSQASCSSLESSVADSDKRKVSKVYNVDTINRRNIVASAKCRSGRDVKLKSPVVETKFSHESLNRSPSPTNKTSDRLSTLTSSVSALATKGENRRRNKIFVDSDSDSDSEVNIRQRKSDYKNTRLKRNSSLSNKSKQNEINQDVEKAAEAPKPANDEIANEINKGCLEYCDSVKPVFLQKKNSFGTSQSNKEIKQVEKLIEIRNGALYSEKNDLNISDSTKKAKFASIVTKDAKNISIHSINPKNNELSTTLTQTFRLIKGAGTGVGLILAGGIDCEAKDVTVHRVLADSIAAKAGIKRGSKVTNINGNSMLGLTHAQSVTILKEQRSEVTIEIEKEVQQNGNLTAYGSERAESNGDQTDVATRKDVDKKGRPVVTVMLEKAGGGAGLGFGLDGGRDSPQGDRPLTIKKLFAGGAAAQSGRIVVGAELISAGGQSMEGFTRTQAWAALKALPAGRVALVLRNPNS